MTDWTRDELEQEVYDRLADALMVLSEVTSGDFSKRLDSPLPEDHPFAPLFLGINETLDSLQSAKERQEGYQRELEEKLEMIERQRSAIRELSTPVIEVWPGVLCLPVVGVMDTTRSSEMTETLLKAVAAKPTECVIVDITGIEVLDTSTADHFMRMARAVQLLGSRCVLTGMSPAIAQTVVSMGAEISGIQTHRSLSDALDEFVRRKIDAATNRPGNRRGGGSVAIRLNGKASKPGER